MQEITSQGFMKIGFIGLGKMGFAIAQNLLQAGHDVTVYNRTKEKAEPLAQSGAKVSDDLSGAVTGAEAVFTMLADDAALSSVSDALFAHLEPNSVHVGSSTISVEFARKLTAEHKQRGQTYVSAPVFGRPDAAENKRLVVVAAGESDAIERIHPLLDAIGRQTFVAGNEPWQANAIKLCGNFMIASMIETFSEVFATLRKAGIDPHQFLSVILEVFGSPVYANYGKQIADRRFETAGGGFGLHLGLKDVRLMSQFAESVASPMPVASLLGNHLLSAVAKGYGNLDWTAVARVLAQAAGLPD
jgi:3-hydroxyisobutyrate dehydrogenase-like beta-hydroxyacid dehydrogenase